MCDHVSFHLHPGPPPGSKIQHLTFKCWRCKCQLMTTHTYDTLPLVDLIDTTDNGVNEANPPEHAIPIDMITINIQDMWESHSADMDKLDLEYQGIFALLNAC